MSTTAAPAALFTFAVIGWMADRIAVVRSEFITRLGDMYSIAVPGMGLVEPSLVTEACRAGLDALDVRDDEDDAISAMARVLYNVPANSPNWDIYEEETRALVRWIATKATS